MNEHPSQGQRADYLGDGEVLSFERSDDRIHVTVSTQQGSALISLPYAEFLDMVKEVDRYE